MIENEKSAPLEDIDPFTIMGIFNRGTTDDNRRDVAKRIAAFLGVAEPLPKSFEGIPVLNQQMSMFFGYSEDRKPGDIDALWNIFDKALDFADADDADTRTDFIEAYTNASQVHCVGWNLTMGLYWFRPWAFPTLDKQSQTYISSKLQMTIGRNGAKHRASAEDYLEILDTLKVRFLEDGYPVHSFPDLSLAAWQYRKPSTSIVEDKTKELVDESDEDFEPDQPLFREPPVPYSLEVLLGEGCFIANDRLDFILQSLRQKKNLILQGPPGTGKSWLAKRMGYALIGAKDESKLRAVQFHPNLSYEDFVRGYRPNGQGKLELVEGPFMEMIAAAAKDPNERYVIVIEEINRGNPAQIFGEMLTLMEADKRNPDEALELSYRKRPGEKVSIPDNLYIIGTMNIADRSLALVDLALRRRFAFVELEPLFNEAWRSWVLEKMPIDPELLDAFANRIAELNSTIEGDPNLKRQCRIGHSYLTPSSKNDIKDPVAWYRQVVETQIGPLLEEYWFDQLDKASSAKVRLLVGL
jgi:5-methylcytosine-specific restriction protein B